MFNFLLLMLPVVLIAVLALVFFKNEVTYWEFFGQIGAVAVVLGLGLALAYYSGTQDVEVWNGQVTGRQRLQVSCSHSYDCNCYYTSETTCSGSGRNRSCRTSQVRHCSTCYEHPYDVNWQVQASTGESVDIDRVDRQGIVMPERWAKSYVGEPWASQHSFENYILANPDSVLLGTKGDTQRWAKLIPSYPAKIYDYYYNDPVLNMGVPNVDIAAWNYLVRESNKSLGTQKQVHLIVLLIPTSDRSYLYALKDAWLGGKKNDVDVILGSVDGQAIAFAEVMSWSTNKELAVVLRDRIEAIGNLQRKDEIVQAIAASVSDKFQRMRMKDMRWVMRSFQPSTGVMIGLFVLAILLEGGLAAWSIMNDITPEEI